MVNFYKEIFYVGSLVYIPVSFLKVMHIRALYCLALDIKSLVYYLLQLHLEPTDVYYWKPNSLDWTQVLSTGVFICFISDIMAASIKKIDAESCRNFNPLVTFDCRGLQPTDFTPGVRMDILLLGLVALKWFWWKDVLQNYIIILYITILLHNRQLIDKIYNDAIN